MELLQGVTGAAPIATHKTWSCTLNTDPSNNFIKKAFSAIGAVLVKGTMGITIDNTNLNPHLSNGNSTNLHPCRLVNGRIHRMRQCTCRKGRHCNDTSISTRIFIDPRVARSTRNDCTKGRTMNLEALMQPGNTRRSHILIKRTLASRMAANSSYPGI